LLLYSSHWAARSALNDYKADPGKVHVVPFGANIPEVSNFSEVERRVAERPSDKCRLLFLGVNWERKGGRIALDVARELNRRGLPTEMDIVGATPPVKTEIPSYVRSHGFISKKEAQGKKVIEKLLMDAHFLILPSRAECFGIVFAEASASGTPSLASNTGGIPDAVRQGRNGYLVPVSTHEDEVRQYVEIVLRVIQDQSAYRALAMSSIEEYKERLNWVTAGSAASKLMEGVLERSC
jgi:glycosyltransferase involved in cell wall biosynthesis